LQIQLRTKKFFLRKEKIPWIKMNKKIIDHFEKKDKVIFSVLKKVGPIKKIKPDSQKNYFSRLCREIIHQQLAGTICNVIFSRFKELFSSKKITPRKLLKIPHSKLRKAGLSNAKAKYVKNLAKSIVNKELNFNNFKNLSDEEITEKLCRVKGIGKWTSEMFLMFIIGRKDVFSHGDLGLRKAIKKLYKFKKEPTRKQIESIVNKWRPYRTYGCLILWASVDGK